MTAAARKQRSKELRVVEQAVSALWHVRTTQIENEIIGEHAKLAQNKREFRCSMLHACNKSRVCLDYIDTDRHRNPLSTHPFGHGSGAVTRAAVINPKCLVTLQPPEPGPLLVPDGRPLRHRADFDEAETKARQDSDGLRVLVKTSRKTYWAAKTNAGNIGAQNGIRSAKAKFNSIEKSEALNGRAQRDRGAMTPFRIQRITKGFR